jgi:hypothetical protein
MIPFQAPAHAGGAGTVAQQGDVEDGPPGALAASGTEGPAATRQRVSAAEASSRAPGRIRKTVTPDFSAASARRRVAVRSSALWLPQGSMMTAPSPGSAPPPPRRARRRPCRARRPGSGAPDRARRRKDPAHKARRSPVSAFFWRTQTRSRAPSPWRARPGPRRIRRRGGIGFGGRQDLVQAAARQPAGKRVVNQSQAEAKSLPSRRAPAGSRAASLRLRRDRVSSMALVLYLFYYQAQDGAGVKILGRAHSMP